MKTIWKPLSPVGSSTWKLSAPVTAFQPRSLPGSPKFGRSPATTSEPFGGHRRQVDDRGVEERPAAVAGRIDGVQDSQGSAKSRPTHPARRWAADIPFAGDRENLQTTRARSPESKRMSCQPCLRVQAGEVQAPVGPDGGLRLALHEDVVRSRHGNRPVLRSTEPEPVEHARVEANSKPRRTRRRAFRRRRRSRPQAARTRRKTGSARVAPQRARPAGVEGIRRQARRHPKTT